MKTGNYLESDMVQGSW